MINRRMEKRKMCVILIGNLTIADLEKDLGIKFNDEDRQYLTSTRQEDVSKSLLTTLGISLIYQED